MRPVYTLYYICGCFSVLKEIENIQNTKGFPEDIAFIGASSGVLYRSVFEVSCYLR